ncbi:Sec-independent protein translocase protein TatB [Ancylobacter sp. SL191]|uniref:Sec-independent protein translocase protein TatB n=1 Tax=Ancylobacter sp. SL191 TaxID=2995166 RepID=UPI0022708D87|nr:Sec-independent protein translocase protein TatB [Ancylobacter sp. SL191]WAC26116.1 Sec-independent protein translocase protein TatB [Ancylobacter sp. SL191]
MLDIGWSELLVIGVVALVVIGPKELPTVLRKIGQGVGKLRRMAGEFQGQFNEALREAELSDLKDSVSGLRNDLSGLADNARSTLSNAFPTNPLQDLDTEMKATSTPVERTDLPAADIEAQLPAPSELETHAFETIEDEVRAATQKMEPAGPAGAAVAAAAPVSASAAPATAQPPAPAAVTPEKAPTTAPAAPASTVADAPPRPALPKRATRRKAAPASDAAADPVVAPVAATPKEIASKEIASTESAPKRVAKPRVRAKAAEVVASTGELPLDTPPAAAKASPKPRSRAAKAPAGSTGNEGPGA